MNLFGPMNRLLVLVGDAIVLGVLYVGVPNG